jgi:hypothetical protein
MENRDGAVTGAGASVTRYAKHSIDIIDNSPAIHCRAIVSGSFIKWDDDQCLNKNVAIWKNPVLFLMYLLTFFRKRL